MIRFLSRVVRNERGASIIELALIMPFLAAMVVGVVDVSRAYSAKYKLEQAAYRAIEKVQQYRDTTTTFTTIQTEATTAATAAGFTNPNVTIDVWLECNGTRQTNYNATCSGQTMNRWITVDIAGSYTPLFASRRWPGSNADGTYTLHGRAGLRTQ